MAAMDELGALLQSLLALKAPGITKTKIEGISQFCVQNVQSDATIVQKIVDHFNASPATHKLGVIYVVDTVTRQWIENARNAGQAVSKNAAPGTFASGVQRVTDVLPTMMRELIQSAPDNQQEKISKLLDIWERGRTFPIGLIAGFKQQLSGKQKDTFTPPGNPPKDNQQLNGQVNPPQSVQAQNLPSTIQDNAALLAALSAFGQQNLQPPVQTNPVPAAPLAFPFQQGVAPPPPGFVPPPPVAFNGSSLPPPPPTGGSEMMQQIVQALASGMIPQEQAIPLLALLAQQQAGGAPVIPPPPQPAINPSVAISQPQVAQNGVLPERYEQNGSRYRDRSRSPDDNRRRFSPDRRSPPNRRDSPTYGVYDPNAGGDGNNSSRQQERERGRGRGRNRGRNEYRQRTPPAQRRQPSPGPSANRGPQQKFLEWDNTLPRDNIKVLSRTLFVGGAGGTEGEIRNIFNRFGRVQTCIVNGDKRHAFVKMVNRRDAVAAKDGMDNMSDPATLSKARQTRWGVGFGPRDCSDYNTGISIIPISRLTDADKKWVVTAEYGGTGGRPLEGNMVLEEPDIEIGAGVSSKAISRRVPQVEAGRRGGHGGHGGGFGGRGNHDNTPRFRRNERPPVPEPRRISPRPEPNVAVPPAVPGFGFQLPGF